MKMRFGQPVFKGMETLVTKAGFENPGPVLCQCVVQRVTPGNNARKQLFENMPDINEFRTESDQPADGHIPESPEPLQILPHHADNEIGYDLEADAGGSPLPAPEMHLTKFE